MNQEKIRSIIEDCDSLVTFPHGNEHCILPEHYDMLASEIANSGDIIPDVRLSLLKVAKCPCCDGSGAIPHEARTPEGSYVDWEQCQWCDERNKVISNEA